MSKKRSVGVSVEEEVGGEERKEVTQLFIWEAASESNNALGCRGFSESGAAMRQWRASESDWIVKGVEVNVDEILAQRRAS